LKGKIPFQGDLSSEGEFPLGGRGVSIFEREIGVSLR